MQHNGIDLNEEVANEIEMDPSASEERIEALARWNWRRAAQHPNCPGRLLRQYARWDIRLFDQINVKLDMLAFPDLWIGVYEESCRLFIDKAVESFPTLLRHQLAAEFGEDFLGWYHIFSANEEIGRWLRQVLLARKLIVGGKREDLLRRCIKDVTEHIIATKSEGYFSLCRGIVEFDPVNSVRDMLNILKNRPTSQQTEVISKWYRRMLELAKEKGVAFR
jgi:hypothetical protein